MSEIAIHLQVARRSLYGPHTAGDAETALRVGACRRVGSKMGLDDAKRVPAKPVHYQAALAKAGLEQRSTSDWKYRAPDLT